MNLFRLALAVCGTVLLLLWGYATLAVLLSTLSGDCAPEIGTTCPTPTDDIISATYVAAISSVGFAVMIWAIRRIGRFIKQRQ